MRKLNRDQTNVPECLAQFHFGEHTWDDVGACKGEIHACLERMQGRWCAFCEGSLDSLGAHIEHFRRRRDFPQFTFSWRNLYWSCDKHDSCGHYKDHAAGNYDVDALIDPCVDDPDVFFHFRSNGTISIRNGLHESDRRRAEETLRVFGLDAQWGRLRLERENCIKKYRFFVEGLAGYTPSEVQELLTAILAAAEAEPYFTAIRHVLTQT